MGRFRSDTEVARAAALLAAARERGWGDRHHPQAAARARKLRDGGCSLKEIAALFGVSHTAIMQWTGPRQQRLIIGREWRLILALRAGKARVRAAGQGEETSFTQVPLPR